jgi:hypothetical protein
VFDPLPDRSLLLVALVLAAACSVDARSVTLSRSACEGLPVEQALITDFSDATETTDRTGHPGITYTTGPLERGGTSVVFAAPSMVPPTLSLISQGDNRALKIDASPATPSDLDHSWFGFALGFGLETDLCVDASSFRGVQFTVDGTASTCSFMVQVDISQDIAIDETNSPVAACTLGVYLCYPPFSLPLTVNGPTHFAIPFTALSDGSPIALVDPKTILGISWKFFAPLEGPPCVASLILDDVAFFR